MDLNYFAANDRVLQVQISQPCPGCGCMKSLAEHYERISCMKNILVYWIDCSCGWRDPDADHPIQAAKTWELRDLLSDSE